MRVNYVIAAGCFFIPENITLVSLSSSPERFSQHREIQLYSEGLANGILEDIQNDENEDAQSEFQMSLEFEEGPTGQASLRRFQVDLRRTNRTKKSAWEILIRIMLVVFVFYVIWRLLPLVEK